MPWDAITEKSLRDRQANNDKAMHDECGAVLASHPFLADSTLETQELTSPGICEGDGCEDPGLSILDRRTFTRRSVCQHCINVMRLDSLCHGALGDDPVCYHCEIRYDPYGFVIGAEHSLVNTEDLKKIVAAGRLVKDRDTGVIRILDES